MATSTVKKQTTRTKSQATRTKSQAKRTQASVNRTAVSARRTAEQAERTVRTIVLDGAYVAVGLGDTAVAFARTLPTKVTELTNEGPRKVEINLTTLRSRTEREFDTLAERGRNIVKTAQRNGSTKQALDSTRVARSQVKAASTSIRKAMFAGANAVETTVESAGRQAEKEQYKAMTVAELHDIAARKDIEGRSGMTKDQLIRALLKA